MIEPMTDDSGHAIDEYNQRFVPRRVGTAARVGGGTAPQSETDARRYNSVNCADRIARQLCWNVFQRSLSVPESDTAWTSIYDFPPHDLC